MKAIIIAGKAESGKDTTALIIKEIFNKKKITSIIFHYADILKCFLKNALEWDGVKNEYGRNLLQKWGTDIIRKNYNNTFTDIMCTLIKGLGNSFDYIIIPDARFINECEEIKNICDEVITFRIERNNILNSLNNEQKNHISETQLDTYKFDYYILNDGSLCDLKNKLKKIIK